MDSARKKAAAEEAPMEISKALATIADAPHMAIAGDLWAGTAPGPDGRPRVTVAWTPREGALGRGISVRATAEGGRVHFDGPVARHRLALHAAAGTLLLR